MARRKIAIVGFGKIARDQHVPVIGRSRDFELAATVSADGAGAPDLPAFESPAELYRALPEIETVAVCTPPAARHAIVREALQAGRDVLMEKPPATTLSALEDLVALARRRKRVLFQAWHSQYNDAVEAARKKLRAEGVRSLRIDWRENVRKWHPGQQWVWQPGGFGVFDPGINALSIFTRIMPFPVIVDSARLGYPANRDTPVDAEIRFRPAGRHEAEISAGFNWLEADGEVWTITVETLRGDQLKLEKGGAVLRVNGVVRVEAPPEEYERIYARFARRLDKRRSDVDAAPFRLVADAFLVGRRETVAPFDW